MFYSFFLNFLSFSRVIEQNKNSLNCCNTVFGRPEKSHEQLNELHIMDQKQLEVIVCGNIFSTAHIVTSTTP